MLIRIKKLYGYNMWKVVNMNDKAGLPFTDIKVGQTYPAVARLDGDDASAPYYDVKGYFIHPDDVEVVDYE